MRPPPALRARQSHHAGGSVGWADGGGDFQGEGEGDGGSPPGQRGESPEGRGLAPPCDGFTHLHTCCRRRGRASSKGCCRRLPWPFPSSVDGSWYNAAQLDAPTSRPSVTACNRPLTDFRHRVLRVHLPHRLGSAEIIERHQGRDPVADQCKEVSARQDLTPAAPPARSYWTPARKSREALAWKAPLTSVTDDPRTRPDQKDQHSRQHPNRSTSSCHTLALRRPFPFRKYPRRRPFRRIPFDQTHPPLSPGTGYPRAKRTPSLCASFTHRGETGSLRAPALNLKPDRPLRHRISHFPIETLNNPGV